AGGRAQVPQNDLGRAAQAERRPVEIPFVVEQKLGPERQWAAEVRRAAQRSIGMDLGACVLDINGRGGRSGGPLYGRGCRRLKIGKEDPLLKVQALAEAGSGGFR